MLKFRHLLLTGIALLSLTPIIAKAGGAPSETYAEVGSWSIEYHPSTNRCSMMQTFDRGTTFFVNRDQGVWNFAFGNPAWSGRLQAGKRYQITAILDGLDKWTDTFEARQVNDSEIALYFNNVSTDFLLSVMRRNVVDFYVTKSGGEADRPAAQQQLRRHAEAGRVHQQSRWQWSWPAAGTSADSAVSRSFQPEEATMRKFVAILLAASALTGVAFDAEAKGPKPSRRGGLYLGPGIPHGHPAPANVLSRAELQWCVNGEASIDAADAAIATAKADLEGSKQG